MIQLHTATVPRSKSAFLLQSHKADPCIRNLFETLVTQVSGDCDVFLLADRAQFDEHFPSKLIEGLNVGVVTYDTFELFEEAFEYNRENAPWLDKRRAFYKTEYLPFVRFFEVLPQYDELWRVEYDVRYTGHWAKFVRDLSSSDAGLITTSLVDFYGKEPHWNHWWRYRGSYNVEQLTRSHNAIFRLKSSAADVLRENIFDHRGHYEIIMPSVLNNNGVPIEDLGCYGKYTPKEREGLYYYNDIGRRPVKDDNHDKFTHSSFGNYFDSACSKQDFIYHPYKVPRSLKWHPDWCYYV
jgi:hypothetical protein